jgi:hypothetical protein
MITAEKQALGGGQNWSIRAKQHLVLALEHIRRKCVSEEGVAG